MKTKKIFFKIYIEFETCILDALQSFSLQVFPYFLNEERI